MHRSVSLHISVMVVGFAVSLANVARAENAYVFEPGTVWFKLGYSMWRADARFAGPFNDGVDLNQGNEPGDTTTLKAGDPRSELRVDAVDIELRASPLRNLLLRLNVPVYQRIAFSQSDATFDNDGVGDVRAFVGYALSSSESRLLTQARLHVKVPTTSARFEDGAVPLSEGQVDVGGELVGTWRALDNLWLSASLLYRHRFEVEADGARFKPGNEMEWSLQLEGGPVRSLWLKATLDSFTGQAWQDLTLANRERPIVTARDQRELLSTTVGAYWSFGELLHPAVRTLALDLQLRHPWAGRDWPKGPQVFVGVAYSFTISQSEPDTDPTSAATPPETTTNAR